MEGNTMTKTWKKMAVFAVLALFIISMVPAAFAERGEDSSNSGRGEDSSEREKQLRMKKDAAVERVNKVRENIEEARENVKEIRENIKEKKAEANDTQIIDSYILVTGGLPAIIILKTNPNV